jgi:hypothetical protein
MQIIITLENMEKNDLFKHFNNIYVNLKIIRISTSFLILTPIIGNSFMFEID